MSFFSFILLAPFLFSVALAEPGARATLIAQMSPPTNQKDTLQCWVVAGASRLDFWASKKYGTPFKISPKFILYQRIYREVFERIEHGRFEQEWDAIANDGSIQNGTLGYFYYLAGGVWPDVVATLRGEGLMPDAVYSEPNLFPTTDVVLYKELNQFMGVYDKRWQARGRKVWSLSERKQIKKELRQILHKTLGTPPAFFVYNGRRHSARSFARLYFAEWFKGGGQEINYFPQAQYADRRLKESDPLYGKAYDGRRFPVYVTNTKMEDGRPKKIIGIIEESLKKEEAILIQFKIVDRPQDQYFIQDPQTGDIGFAINRLIPDFNLNWEEPSYWDHYALAVGGKWDAEGHLTELLIKNPWALDTNGKAYHWMKKDYFWLLIAAEIDQKLLPSLKAQGLIPQ